MAVPVRLTFGVSNVVKTTCSGLLQPTCVDSQAGGFNESLTIDTSVFSTANNGVAGFADTLATFGFPFLSTGNPYTNGLKAILAQAPTSVTSSSQFENFFDTSSGFGLATGLVTTDQSYDDGAGSTGDFQQSYSLQALLGSLASYKNLQTVPLLSFLAPLVNQLSGSFYEAGTASVLDQDSLLFTRYAFTSYAGDVSLIAAANVPEPATVALLMAGLVGIGLGRRSTGKVRARR